RARDYVEVFKSGADPDHWTRVRKIADLKPGDVIAWLKPADVDSTNTGHIMIVETPPKMRAGGEWVVGILDSSARPHGASDSRKAADITGLGHGTIVLIPDADGAPRAYRWSEWRKSEEHETEIVLARPH